MNKNKVVVVVVVMLLYMYILPVGLSYLYITKLNTVRNNIHIFTLK